MFHRKNYWIIDKTFKDERWKIYKYYAFICHSICQNYVLLIFCFNIYKVICVFSFFSLFEISRKWKIDFDIWNILIHMMISMNIYTFFWHVELDDFILKIATEKRFFILNNVFNKFYTLIFIKMFNFVFVQSAEN